MRRVALGQLERERRWRGLGAVTTVAQVDHEQREPLPRALGRLRWLLCPASCRGTPTRGGDGGGGNRCGGG